METSLSYKSPQHTKTKAFLGPSLYPKLSTQHAQVHDIASPAYTAMVGARQNFQYCGAVKHRKAATFAPKISYTLFSDRKVP